MNCNFSAESCCRADLSAVDQFDGSMKKRPGLPGYFSCINVGWTRVRGY